MAYSQQEINTLFTHICDEMSKGRSLRSVLRDEDMPHSDTFYIWVNSDRLKTVQYAQACEKRAEKIFEEMLSIADDSTNDTMYIETKGGKEIEVEDKEWTNRSRLRIDTRKWMLSKMMPKKYGDKLDITTDGEKIATPVIKMLPPSNGVEPKTE
jgi:hypothetical protein